jgi:hypothetical protein
MHSILVQWWQILSSPDERQNRLCALHSGTYKVRNEIETKRNETKRNQQKRNETKRNEINKNETKRNETKSTKWKRNRNHQTIKSNLTFTIKRVNNIDYGKTCTILSCFLKFLFIECLTPLNNNISVISWRINWIWYEWHSSNNLIRSGVVILSYYVIEILIWDIFIRDV